MKLGMAEKELKEKSAKWKEVEREAGEGTKAIEKGRKEVEALRKKVQDSGWSVEREAHVDVELKKAKENVRMLTEVNGFVHLRGTTRR
jgi:structural maintenance of chromosome 2